MLQAELWLERHDSGDRDPGGWGGDGMKEREIIRSDALSPPD